MDAINNPVFGGGWFKKGRDKAAFHGKMSCPYCSIQADPTTTPIGFETEKRKIRLVGNIGPFLREYKCMICGGIWRYDFAQHQTHPYSSFKRGLNLKGVKFSGAVPLIGSKK